MATFSSAVRAFRFYWVVAASGAVLMALEILSSRLLSPHFGSSVYVWGSIIGVFLAALSVGYSVGGHLADRYPSLAALGRLVALTAVCLAGLLLAGERWVGLIGGWTAGSPAGTLLATAVLFGPATVLLGTVSPYAVRLAARDLGYLGHTAGRLYAVSAVGSLVGTLGCTFLLIPFLQMGQILGLLLAVTAVTAGLALAGEVRRQLPATVLTALALVLALPHLRGSSDYGGALFKRITPYQTLEVVDRDGVRYLRSENVTQAGIRLADGRAALAYTRLVPAALLLNPDLDRVLLLGMGGGDMGAYLRRGLPGVEMEYVEIDPVVVEVAERFFHFEPGPADRVHVDDARRFLATRGERWDLIVVDTYIGLSVPFHLATAEFFTLARRHLEPGGVLALNLAAGLEAPFSRATARTVAESFPSCYLFAAETTANVMLFATDRPTPLTDAELAARARRLGASHPFELPLGRLVERRRPLDPELYSAPLLRDDFAPVERLISLSEAGMPEIATP